MKYRMLIKLVTFVLNGYIILLCFFPIKAYSNNKSSADNAEYSIDEIKFKFIKTESFDKNTLLDIMTLPKKKVFDHDDLEKDVQIIRKFYFDNGFFNAVVDTSSQFDDEDMSVIITIIILEKNRYKINEFRYSGLEHVVPEVMAKINQDQLVKKGNDYNRSSILDETNRVLDALQNNGYAFARIDTINGTVIEKSYTEDYVNVTLAFLDAGKQYRFGKTKINIVKNVYGLSNHLIERELDYKEGDMYNREHVLQSERNFSNFSIIQRGTIQVDTVYEDRAVIDHVVTITLTNKYELTPSIIGTNIDNQFYVGAGLEYSDKNFFGGGRVFSIGVNGYFHSPVINQGEIKASLYQPYFLQATTTATYNISLGFYNISENIQSVILKNLFRVTFNLPTFTFYNRALTDITGDLIRTKTIYPDSNNIKVITNSMDAIIGFTLQHDNTNDLFNPSKGFYHTISASNGGLLPKFINLFSHNLDYAQYVKLYTLNKFYTDLTDQRRTSIAAAYFRIGDIIEYGKGNNIVPIDPNYKFYSGGSNSVRGWNAKENGYVLQPEFGGNFIFEGSLEYRQHLFYNNQDFWKNFWFVYFIDYGNIWDSPKYFRFNEVALATGIGLRYNTFVGPLRIDFGFKLYDPKADTGTKWLFDKKSQVFHQHKIAIQFGLGNAF